MARADPLARLNSSERRLEVSELVKRSVWKAWLALGYVAAERGWEPSSFRNQITRVYAKSEFPLYGFGDPSDREEGRVTATSQDSEDGSGVNSSILGEPRGSFEAVPLGMSENIREPGDSLVKVVG